MVQLTELSRVTSPDFPGAPGSPESWLQGVGEVLREMPHRRVYRSEVAGRRVIVKEFLPEGLRRSLRKYAETEADTALATAQREVPIVEPLAWARLRDGRQLLILKEEEGARTLREVVLSKGRAGSGRHRLARNVGALFAKMQNAGIRHRDPHAGNILVRPDDSVLLADAWDLKLGDYLRPRERAEDLARFALFFLTHCSRVDLLVFWGEYGPASMMQPEELEDLRRDVLERVPANFRKLTSNRTRQRRRKGRPFRYATWQGSVTGMIEEQTLRDIVTRATHLGDGPDILKKSPTCWTFTFGDDFVVKAFQPKKATRGIRDAIQGTRAERAMESAEAFRHRGLETPEVVAVLKDDAARSILVMRRVTDAGPIDEVGAGLATEPSRAAARLLGRTLRRMHDWGLRHRDLKNTNVWLSADGSRICFLDLDGVRQTRAGQVDWERRARDLAHLDGSILDGNAVPIGLRLRALDAYLQAGELPDGFQVRAFARRLTRLALTSRERRLSR